MPKLHKVLKVFQYIFDPGYRFIKDSRRGKYDHLSDEEYLKRRFMYCFKRELNLHSPKSFNEKLQWLKLYARNPEYTVMVDKLAVKKYVEDRIGAEYIIPTLGVWEKFDDIDFDTLPDQFVLKCTHDSGGLVICRDKSKLDKSKADKRISGSLKRDFYMRSREWPYKNVQRKIIAEKYMEDSAAKELIDYKVHTFNGEPKFILVCSNRFNKKGMNEDFYTIEWKRINVRRPWAHNSKESMKLPDEMEKILELSRILSKGIPFLRVDFYIVNHKIYFGELTFFPASGFLKFIPKKYDRLFGELLKLPDVKTCIDS